MAGIRAAGANPVLFGGGPPEEEEEEEDDDDDDDDHHHHALPLPWQCALASAVDAGVLYTTAADRWRKALAQHLKDPLPW